MMAPSYLSKLRTPTRKSRLLTDTKPISNNTYVTNINWSAAQIDTTGLTEAQIAQLKANAAQQVANNTKGPFSKKAEQTDDKEVSATLALASTWGNQAAAAAEGFSRAITIAAKELGVTVNDFLHTDAGKLTAALIVWKVAGAQIIGTLYGLLFIIVGLSFARVMYLRLFTQRFDTVEYNYFGVIKGTKQVRVPKSFDGLSTDGEWMMLWVIIIAVFATLFIGAAFVR